MPVIPATQEAEAGELLQPGRRRFQWAEIVPSHSSLSKKRGTLWKKKSNTDVFAYVLKARILKSVPLTQGGSRAGTFPGSEGEWVSGPGGFLESSACAALLEWLEVPASITTLPIAFHHLLCSGKDLGEYINPTVTSQNNLPGQKSLTSLYL